MNEKTVSAETFEWIDPQPHIVVDEAEYKRLLGFPPAYEIQGRSRELADQARDWYSRHGRGWMYARLVDNLELESGLILGGTAFLSEAFHSQLRDAGAHAAFVVAVSAGPECESKARQLWLEGKPDEYFFMETFGSAVVEHLVAALSGRLCAWADGRGMAVLPHYSPGYTGWDVSDQVPLWSLIESRRTKSFPGPLEVLESGMPRPKKSLLGVFGLTRHLDRVMAIPGMVPCERCALPGCKYRRVPYRRGLPQVEDMQAAARETSAGSAPAANGSALQPHAYRLNAKALRKWASERLQLRVHPNGSVEATFRYDGTTCSNMGRPLQFEYHVQLKGPESGYRIESAKCAPAPGDTGHQFMCEYLRDSDALMRAIEMETPEAGMTLTQALVPPPVNPAGCFCVAESRAHKWHLVLEVIHFALRERHET